MIFHQKKCFIKTIKPFHTESLAVFFSGTLTIEADSKSNEKITGALK